MGRFVDAPGFGLAVLLLACGEATTSAGPALDPSTKRDGVMLATPVVKRYRGPKRGSGKMPGTRATAMEDALRSAGLDPRNLPPLETLAPGPKQRVMRTFSAALGASCMDCHAQDDFSADTRRKRVAKRMWNEMVRVLAMKDGAPVYCDSCHDGALFHLDRSNGASLAEYMCNAMVGNLKRVDGRSHDCTTCHGDPPELHLLRTWKEEPAPQIVQSSLNSSTSSADRVIVPKTWPIEGPRAPEDCGENGHLCPLSAWMRLVIMPAARDPAKREDLAEALERVADYAQPDQTSSFAAMAKESARIARTAKTESEVQASCAACHIEHKATWRAKYRTVAPGLPHP